MKFPPTFIGQCSGVNNRAFLKWVEGRLSQAMKVSTGKTPPPEPDEVELTSIRYPEVKRKSFAVLTDSDVTHFQSIMERSRVIQDENVIKEHNTDWMKIVRGSSKLLLRPKSTKEVSSILEYCNERRLAVCPQSGNTGLVGGSVPVFDEIILSLNLMNKIIQIDSLSGVVQCESGCILENVDSELHKSDLMMPLDLGAKGSCLIGGNIATNAGGLRLIKYGSLHGSVLGLEMVLASGEVIDCMSTMRKDNTGYDLKHLFIGSEGTLGVITKAAIQCVAKPRTNSVAFLALSSFESVLELFRLARGSLSEILSSFEFADHSAIEVALQQIPSLQYPLAEHNDFYILIETSGSNQGHDLEKLTSFLEEAMSKGLVSDGTVVSESSKIKNLWHIRESITLALSQEGYQFKYDLSIPLKDFYQLVPIVRQKLKSKPKFIRCCGFGHIGDSNIHLNVTSRGYCPDIAKELEPFLFEWVSQKKGSLSAEHGLGFKKRQFIHLSKSNSAIKMMGLLKRSLDPNGILNPYKVLPD